MTTSYAQAQTVHPAQVAGRFYSADRDALAAKLDSQFRAAAASTLRAKMIVMPHAGIEFCGVVAASAARTLDLTAGPRRIVILGPSHRTALRGAAVHPAAMWSTPLGTVPVAREALNAILPLEGVALDASPFESEHSLEVPLLFLQRMFPQMEIAPVLVGAAAPEFVEEILRRMWGGPETAICVSSDLSHFLAADAARAKDASTRALIETGRWTQLGPAEACGFASLSGAMRRAASFRMRATGVAFATSDQFGGPRDRVVGYGGFAFEYPGVARLTEAERLRLIGVASACAEYAATRGGATPAIVARSPLAPSLLARRGAFVTLERQGALRGCVGTLAPHMPLLGDVGVNAVKAGFSDPRFGPLQPSELPDLTIKISVLSPASPIPCRDEAELLAQLRPDRDGLLLRDGPAGAVFLPSVWRDLPSPVDFVRQLKRKMGAAADHWSANLTAERFDVESFGGAYMGPENLDLGEVALQAPG